MSDDSKRTEQVETMVVRALERKPEIEVPTDFAARVAQSLPAKPASQLPIRPIFGRVAGYLAAVAVMVGLLVLAKTHPEALEAGRGFVFGMEILLLAQLLAVGLWLGMRDRLE
jgi:hypothetical protein